MADRSFQIVEFETEEGNKPFSVWLDGLRDAKGTAIISARIERLRRGLLGDCKSVGHGVFELRIDFGPGYRVYFGMEKDHIVILLCGGDKKRQKSDILRAQAFLVDYRRIGS